MFERGWTLVGRLAMCYRALGKPEIPGVTSDTGILCDKEHLPVVQRGQRPRPAKSS